MQLSALTTNPSTRYASLPRVQPRVGKLIAAIRSGEPTRYASPTDKDMMVSHITKEQLKHNVRRVTVGAQGIFARVEFIINTLKGPAGMDDNQVHLFKGITKYAISSRA
ncbi:Hypp6863 [Branchiostoma lanceolatum]|uniref:Hypp6863 protein n=1 Tax=Branchiostoma lanceolatum TaxID=7740 RepID=A0A8J9YVK5_BRALA|nr:Hypp6863 [Branchiostoma lanceolatum]